MLLSENFKDMKTAQDAYNRVKADIDAVPADDLSPLNVDLVSSTSIVLGVADRILSFRTRIAAQSEFNMKSVDSLIDYALAGWYLYVSNLPAAEPADADVLIAEMLKLRGKLLLWAAPIAASGIFQQAAVDQIREGSGYKDAASDVVALVGLYRSQWDQVKDICAVTEADLERGAELGPLTFAIVSRRENKGTTMPSQSSLQIRKAWTLLDRAYAQCRRAIAYLRFLEDDVDQIAPNLRRNQGRPSASSAVASAASTAATTDNVQVGTAPGSSGLGTPAGSGGGGQGNGGLGGSGGPFSGSTG